MTGRYPSQLLPFFCEANTRQALVTLCHIINFQSFQRRDAKHMNLTKCHISLSNSYAVHFLCEDILHFIQRPKCQLSNVLHTKAYWSHEAEARKLASSNRQTVNRGEANLSHMKAKYLNRKTFKYPQTKKQLIKLDNKLNQTFFTEIIPAQYQSQ